MIVKREWTPEDEQLYVEQVTLATYASEQHKDIYKCGCEIPNGANYDYEFDFVCDHCYELANPNR